MSILTTYCKPLLQKVALVVMSQAEDPLVQIKLHILYARTENELFPYFSQRYLPHRK